MIPKLKNTNFIKKSPVLINDKGINKIVVSSKLPFHKLDFKYFIGYKDFEKIRPLTMFLPQMIICKKILMKIDVLIF